MVFCNQDMYIEFLNKICINYINTYPLENTMVSSTIEDWSRERQSRYSPGEKLIRTIRSYEKHKQRIFFLRILLKPIIVFQHRLWSAVSGADIPLGTQISGGLVLPHPNGIVIHPMAVIGPNCMIFQQVTVGTGSKPGVPIIKGHVDIGAGAKILGGITIGEHSVIGANAVVITDVPPHSLAIGIPARIKNRKET
jgi:serine O-acetyltransferase